MLKIKLWLLPVFFYFFYMIKIPNYLNKGDAIGLVCPSGYLPYEKATTCIQKLQEWGYQVIIGKTLGSQFNYFAGTDEERLSDLQNMLDNPRIKAILCARGGYGMSRIIDQLNFAAFIKNPKWIIGFSDITVLQTHVFQQLHIATLHAPMAGAFNEEGGNSVYVQSLQKAMEGVASNYKAHPHNLNRLGTGDGILVGGNLSLIAHLIGSRSGLNTQGKILFLEDVGEYIYNIDRMMIQLKRNGMLDNLAGLIIGGFTDMKDTTIPFGANVLEVIKANIASLNYPVCFDFPVSHDKQNYALKIGLPHHLVVTATKVQLIEKEQG